MIFDCDGVLVDSEPIANRVLMEGLAELGMPMSYDETMRTFIGRTKADGFALIEERLGRPVPPSFLLYWDDRLFAAFERDLEAIPGIREALDRIAIPVCVASSGSYDKMRVSLGKTGLLARFEGRMFSAVDLSRGKPHPDLFLHAARSMKARPERCAVVEDTVVGVQAGIAAGMTVFAYARGAHSDAGDLSNAGGRVFHDMAALPELLRDGGARVRVQKTPPDSKEG